MKSLIEFIAEMTIADAIKTLGIERGASTAEIKTAFRRASSANHPDKGGSTEKMQQVNAAYELLKKSGASTTSHLNGEPDDMRAKRQETGDKAWQLAQMVRTDLNTKLNVDEYTKYFETTLGAQFNVITLSEYPKANDKQPEYGPTHASRKLEWSNHDRTIVLEMMISVYLTPLIHSKGLTGPQTTYDMQVSTFMYKDRKRVKISSRDWSATSQKSIFTKPDSVFPKAKILKSGTKAFKRADMLAGLKKQVGAEENGDYFFIPLKDGNYLGVYRMTFMRQAFWSTAGIWEKTKSSFRKNKAVDFGLMSFPEADSTLQMFITMAKSNARSVASMAKSEYEKNKA